MTNAEVTAEILGEDADLDEDEDAQATAFGFAQASLNQNTGVALGDPAVEMLNLADENAFVGFGSITL